MQETNNFKNEQIQELQTELSSVRNEAKEQLDNIQQVLDEVIADRNQLEGECAELQAMNTVSNLY